MFDRSLRSVEDWDMWIRIAAYYPFAVIREPLAYYRQLSSSMSKNCQVMEQAFRKVIEKAFQSAPPNLLYLKQRSYGHAYLCLAWKALQSQNQDYKRAIHFRTTAMTHYPQLKSSREWTRLGLAIAMLQWFGPSSYGKLLTLTHALRRRMSNFAR